MRHSLQWLAQMHDSAVLSLYEEFIKEPDIKPLFLEFLEEAYADAQADLL